MESHGLLVLGNCGRKKTRTAGEIERMIKSVPHERRQTLRALAVASVDLGPYSILVKNQPPNSPDFNVLDLNFFKILFKVYSTKRQLELSRS